MKFLAIDKILFFTPYSIGFALSLAVMFIFSMFHSKKRGFDRENTKTVFLVFIVLQLVFGRLIYVFFNRSQILFDSVDGFFIGLGPIFETWKGGFSSFGVVLGFMVSVLLVSKLKKFSFSKALGVFSCPFMLFYALLRLIQPLGNQGYGAWLESGFFPLAIKNNFDEWYVAIFFFEFVIFILAFLYMLFSKKAFNRGYFAMFVIACLQIFFESLHGDAQLRFEINHFIRAEMLLYLVLIVVLLIFKHIKIKKTKALIIDIIMLLLFAAFVIMAEFHEKIHLSDSVLYSLSFIGAVSSSLVFSLFPNELNSIEDSN